MNATKSLASALRYLGHNDRYELTAKGRRLAAKLDKPTWTLVVGKKVRQILGIPR